MKRIIAPALASLLAASAAGLALTPSGAAAQEGTTLMLVPQGGAVTPGQGYVLVPTPGPTGQYGQGFAQGTPLDLGREMFERGYWLGRYEEQLRQAQGQALTARGGGPERPGMVDLPPRYREPGVTTFDRPGEFDIFLAPPPEGLDPQQIRQILREARQALQQGEAPRAEQALARLDQMLGGGERQRLQQALEEAEQALRRNDRQAAEEALRRARQAVGGQQQAQLTTQPGQGQQASPAAAQRQPPQATGAAQVAAEQSEQYGAYLTDAGGRALYLFTADQQGSGATQAQSNCHDACAEAWPPLLTQGEPQAGQRADAALLGTIQRQDGATQVTYNGWPLYYFVQDQGPGEATGQDKHGFGGEWYLVTPEGEKVEEEEG